MTNRTFTTNVVKGKGRGKDLGFPTINLAVPEDFNLKPGIYACWAKLDQGLALKNRYMGALHYGPVPVFGETQPSLEVHLLDFNKDIHPTNLKITTVKFIRPVQFFDSPDKLIAQIADDVLQTRSILAPKPRKDI